MVHVPFCSRPCAARTRKFLERVCGWSRCRSSAFATRTRTSALCSATSTTPGGLAANFRCPSDWPRSRRSRQRDVNSASCGSGTGSCRSSTSVTRSCTSAKTMTTSDCPDSSRWRLEHDNVNDNERDNGNDNDNENDNDTDNDHDGMQRQLMHHSKGSCSCNCLCCRSCCRSCCCCSCCC